jgi:uncharacterized protein YceH (UPF0502 family)
MAAKTAMVALHFVLLAVIGNASPAQCDSDMQSCISRDAPQVGDAMIQTVATQAPLQGRVTTLQAEVTSLQERVGALTESVGLSLIFNYVSTAQVEKKDPYARYSKLLQSTQDTQALTDDVAELETTVAEIESNLLQLENQVAGNAFTMKFGSSSGAALLSAGSKREASKGGQDPSTSLSTRVVALEEEVSNCRTRVSSLEQTVVGLQVKSG